MARLGESANNIRAELDDAKLVAYQGEVSQPFEPRQHRREAVTIVENRVIESLKVLAVVPTNE